MALLWACQAAGLLHSQGFLVFYTALCLGACIAAWLYMMWQEPRVRGEHAACIHLLALIEGTDTEEGAANEPEASPASAREKNL